MSVMNKLPSNYDESDGSIYVYNQLNEPENKNGIWIKSTDSVNVVHSVYSDYFIQYNNPINYGVCWGIIGSINDNLYAICRTGDADYNYKFNLLKYNNGNVTIIDTMRGSYDYSGIYNNKFITYGYKKLITVDSNGANTLNVEIPTNYSDYELFLINGEPYVIAMYDGAGVNTYDILKISSSGNITTTNRFQYTYASSYDHYASHITNVYYYNSKLYISMYSEFGYNDSWSSVGIANEILVYNPSTNSIENTLEAIADSSNCSISDFIEYNNNLYCTGGANVSYIFKLNNNSLVYTNIEINFKLYDMFLYKGKLYLYNNYLFGLPDPCTIIVSIGYTYIIANINKNDFEWSISPVSYYGSNSKFQDVEIYYGNGTKWNKCTLHTNNL